MTAEAYRVSVRQNLVTAIAPIARSEAHGLTADDDPLAVSSRLAQNNLENGCLDGDYDFVSFEAARQFAMLCLEYLKKLCEKSVTSVAGADGVGERAWRNACIPERQAPGGD